MRRAELIRRLLAKKELLRIARYSNESPFLPKLRHASGLILFAYSLMELQGIRYAT
jgi:hypothetical protein